MLTDVECYMGTTYNSNISYHDNLIVLEAKVIKLTTCDGITKTILEDGMLHSIYEPALVEVDLHKGTIKREWYLFGKLHRETVFPEISGYVEDLPARIITTNNIGKTDIVEEWYMYGEIFRSDDSLPNYVHSKKTSNKGNAIILEKRWYVSMCPSVSTKIDRYYNREEGPCVISCYPDGTLKEECWYLNNMLHRNSGPALLKYSEQGELKEKGWYHNGKLCAVDENIF